MHQIEEFEVTKITTENNHRQEENNTPIIAINETEDNISDSCFDSIIQNKQEHRIAGVLQYARSEKFITSLISRLDLHPEFHSNQTASEFALV